MHLITSSVLNTLISIYFSTVLNDLMCIHLCSFLNHPISLYLSTLPVSNNWHAIYLSIYSSGFEWIHSYLSTDNLWIVRPLSIYILLNNRMSVYVSTLPASTGGTEIIPISHY